MNANLIIRNLNSWPPEALIPYLGRFVAWSADGKAILAHAADRKAILDEMLRRSEKEYVLDYLPAGDEVWLGAADYDFGEFGVAEESPKRCDGGREPVQPEHQ